MGADLYLKSVFDPQYKEKSALFEDAVKRRNEASERGEKELAEEIQKEVSDAHTAMYEKGYYRDSYNGSNSLWVISLSYWELSDTLKVKNGKLNMTSTKTLLRMIDERTEDAPFEQHFAEWVTKQQNERGMKFEGEDNTVDDWKKYHLEKLNDLRGLLKQSLELKEPIIWSV